MDLTVDTDHEERIETAVAQASLVAQQLLALSNGDAVASSVALLVAADRGYTHEETVAAINDGRFLLDGIITDDSGAQLDPIGSDTGIITDKTPIQSLRRASAEPVTTSGLADQLLLELEMVNLAAIPAGPPEAPRIWDVDTVAGIEARNVFVTARITNLRNQGRSVEDIVNAIIFGDIDLCLDELDEAYTLCDNRELVAQRANESADTQLAPSEPATPETDSPAGDDAAATGSYLGQVNTESTVTEGTVLTNNVALEVTEASIVGDIELLIETDFAGDTSCLALFVPVLQDDLAVTSENTYSGPVSVDVGLDLNQGCDAGPPPADTFTDTLTIIVAGSTLSGTLPFDGDPVTFSASLVE